MIRYTFSETAKTTRFLDKNHELGLIFFPEKGSSYQVQGLMTMPPWFDDPQEARPFFVALREFKERVAAENLPRVEMRELSMGMSQDY